MENTKRKGQSVGKFLSPSDRAALKQERIQRVRRNKRKKLLAAAALIAGNVLLQYMITGGSIDPSYGAGFLSVMSAYFGYQMKGDFK